MSQWLEAIELKEYVGAFKKNKVDGVTLLKLGEEDLKEMGVGVSVDFCCAYCVTHKHTNTHMNTCIRC